MRAIASHTEPMTERAPEWSPAVYAELRRMAQALLAGERNGHTLDPTSLAHELWLRLRASRNAGELGEGEFLGLAAQAMRRILVEHARRRGAQKRGGSARRIDERELALELSGGALATNGFAAESAAFVLELEEALTELQAIDAELARVVELRFHAGLGTDEIAAALGTSPRTVKRRWRFARAWLQRRMRAHER